MDSQTILTVIIVAVAVGITIRHFWKAFSSNREGKAPNCSCGCEGCSLKNNCTNNN